MKVPATRPFFSDDDIAYITKYFTGLLRGESFLSMGKYAEEFEASFATYTGTEHAVACNSGTSALELIFRGLAVEGKEVIVPSNTFIATPIAVLTAGATPVFADCGDDMSLDPADTARKITSGTAGDRARAHRRHSIARYYADQEALRRSSVTSGRGRSPGARLGVQRAEGRHVRFGGGLQFFLD